MTKSPILAWSSAGRRISLAKSISSLVVHARYYGHELPIFISSDNSEHSDTGLDPQVLQALDEAQNEHGFSYEISTVNTRKQAINEYAGKFDSELLRFALLPQIPGSYGVNYNTCLLHSAGKKLICTDDDIIFKPAHTIKQNNKDQKKSFSLKNPLFTQDFGNSDLYFYENRQEVLDAVASIEIDIINSYCSFLQSYEEGRVLLINPGLYGESGTSSARGVLALDEISREHFMQNYKTLRYSREVVRIPDIPTISTSVHFMSGNFAADNSLPLAPFIPYGRNSDGLASLINRIMHPESLNGYLNFGLYHAPPERSQNNEQANVFLPDALINYKPGFPNMVIALTLGVAPDMSVIGAKNRLQYLGRQFCTVANLSTSDFVDVFYSAWSYQFNQVIETLENLLDTYNREPLVWAEDVDAHIDSLNFYMREPQALFKSKNNPGCGLSIDEAKEHLDLYGGLLEAWCDLWEAKLQWT